MNEIEREKFEQMILAMGEAEQKFAATAIDTDILWDELRRRETAARNMCIAMKSVMVAT